MSRNIRKRFESFKFKRQSDTRQTLSGFTDGLTDTNSSKGQGKSYDLLNCWEDRCVGSNVRQQFSSSPPPVWGQQFQKTLSILPSAGTTLSKNLSSLLSRTCHRCRPCPMVHCFVFVSGDLTSASLLSCNNIESVWGLGGQSGRSIVVPIRGFPGAQGHSTIARRWKIKTSAILLRIHFRQTTYFFH